MKFLTLMRAGKKGQNEYDLFIKTRSKYEMNIDDDLRKKFDAVAAVKPKPDWSKAPWDKVTTEVIKMFNDNVASKVT